MNGTQTWLTATRLVRQNKDRCAEAFDLLDRLSYARQYGKEGNRGYYERRVMWESEPFYGETWLPENQDVDDGLVLCGKEASLGYGHNPEDLYYVIAFENLFENWDEWSAKMEALIPSAITEYRSKAELAAEAAIARDTEDRRSLYERLKEEFEPHGS